MQKIITASAILLILLLVSCGPAAENRETMHERAKSFQDSIANFLRTSIAEAEAPGPNVVVPAQTPTPAPTATPTAPKK